MAENLLDKFVKFPADDDLQHVIDGFDHPYGFLYCARAVDGTHIPVLAMESAHGNYLNSKGWYSIVLQAVCDHNYILTIWTLDGQRGLMMRGSFENLESYYSPTFIREPPFRKPKLSNTNLSCRRSFFLSYS